PLARVGIPKSLEEHGQGAVFSPDGRYVASTRRVESEPAGARDEADLSARLWEVASGRLVALLRHGEPVGAVAFRPDGKVLLTQGGKAIRFWDVPEGKPLDQPILDIGSIG